jgi:hypothetical protein
MKRRLIFGSVAVVVVAAIGFWLYFFYFNIERSNILKRSIDKYTGQDLTVTIFSYDGKIIKQWHNVKKITSGGDSSRYYTYFYTQDGKYVQIPNSVTYIAEEE